MKRSLFLELLDEESSIPKGGTGAFTSVAELKKNLEMRAAFIKKVELAKASGRITGEQYDRLVELNRRH